MDDLDSTSCSAAVGVISGIAASLFWAAGFVGVRHGLDVGLSPSDLMVHRYTWSGLALLPFMVRAGIGDLNGVGWGRGILLAVLSGPPFAILGYTGFMLVPLGHGGVIQPACGTLSSLLLANWVLHERLRRLDRYSCPTGREIESGCFCLPLFARVVRAGWYLQPLQYAQGRLVSGCQSLWRIAPMPAAVAISVLSLIALPVHWLLGGFTHMAMFG